MNTHVYLNDTTTEENAVQSSKFQYYYNKMPETTVKKDRFILSDGFEGFSPLAIGPFILILQLTVCLMVGF